MKILCSDKIICFYRSNETSEWIDSPISVAGSGWIIVKQLQPYTPYQFQLVLHNESLLHSGWITTDMGGMNFIHPICTLIMMKFNYIHVKTFYIFTTMFCIIVASTVLANTLVCVVIFCYSSKPRTIC